MFYSKWMSYIKDETLITKLVIPGAHNAGSYAMSGMAKCQEDNLYTQFNYGIRQFCLRLDTDKKGNIVLAHGISKGSLLEEALEDVKRALDENPSEIILIDIREYYDQKFGPITLRYKADPRKVDQLLKKHLNPEQNAFTDFSHIKEVTIGDLRRAGKRYILINDSECYAYSKCCHQILPWEKEVNGAHGKSFSAMTLRFFDDYTTDGLYWFQTQQTPNIGTPIGLTKPKLLDKEARMYFKDIIKGIRENPHYLNSANIIAGDFMTEDYMKVLHIISLNLAKGNVKEDSIDAFKNGLYSY